MKYEIWVEGYIGQGERNGEQLMCTAEGDTFQDACIVAFEGNPHFSISEGRLFHWGCELFSTQEEAHKRYGDTWKRPRGWSGE